MAFITIGTLKKLIEHLPEDYTIAHKNDITTTDLSDVIEIDVSNKRLILK